MTDDGPLDLGQVAADAEGIESLRARSDTGADTAFSLLRDLQQDVDAEQICLDRPWPAVVSGRSSSIVVLSGPEATGRRMARGGTAVAVLTAGVLSLGGVAAASTAAPAGSPLHGLGNAVRSAAGTVVDAVTPPESVPRRAIPSASAAPPGATIAAAARSAAAARHLRALLSSAEQLLAAGQLTQAAQRLDQAERRLPEVLPADEAVGLRTRLVELRKALAAAQAESAPGGRPGAPGTPGAKPEQPEQKPAKPETRPEQKSAKPEPKPEQKTAKPQRKPEQKPAKPSEPAQAGKPDSKPAAEPRPADEQSAEESESAEQPTLADAVADKGRGAAQPVRAASAKPRA